MAKLRQGDMGYMEKYAKVYDYGISEIGYIS